VDIDLGAVVQTAAEEMVADREGLEEDLGEIAGCASIAGMRRGDELRDIGFLFGGQG
jgi:hypothetical protein